MLAYTPTSIGTGFNVTKINNNFTAIQTAIAEGLSRSNNTDNAMEVNLDLGTNDILNGGVGNFSDIIVAGSSVAASAAAAAASAAAALASETAAATSASNAATSASNASTSETNAAASAAAASTSETNAAASQSAAAASASAASTSETNAAASAAAASTSASNASTSETNAAASAAAASTSASNASTSASNAAASASAASASASNASTSETNAAASESMANLWANELEDVVVSGGQYSAFHWAQKASASGELVKVSSNDLSADYLLNQLAIANGLTLTELNDGANEQVQIGVGTHLEIGGGASNYTLNLHVNAAATNYTQWTNTTTGNTATDGLVFGIVSSGTTYLWNYENTDTIFGTNNAERMRIKASGNIAIGVDLDFQRMHIHTASAANAFLHFSNTVTGVTASDGLDIGVNASGFGTIYLRDNTTLLFGTNNTTRWEMSGAGGFYANGATGGDKGNGTINADGAMYVDGQIVTGSTLTTANELKRGYTVYTTDKDYEPGGAYGAITISSIATADTWESLGPVGSGADNTDAYLDPLDDLNSPSGIIYHAYALGTIATGTYGTGYVSFNMDKTSASSYGGCNFRAYNGDSLGRVHGGEAGGILSCPSTGIIGVRWGDNVNVSAPSMELHFNGFVEGEAD